MFALIQHHVLAGAARQAAAAMKGSRQTLKVYMLERCYAGLISAWPRKRRTEVPADTEAT
jgi:hypothetical protein